MEFLLHIVAGASVGFAIGLTGVGGGSLMTPLLLVFGYPHPWRSEQIYCTRLSLRQEAH